MNKTKSEVLLIGGACLLAPFVACAVAVTIFIVSGNPVWPMVIGTVTAIALYVAACLIHGHFHGNDKQEEERQSEPDDRLESPGTAVVTDEEPSAKI